MRTFRDNLASSAGGTVAGSVRAGIIVIVGSCVPWGP